MPMLQVNRPTLYTSSTLQRLYSTQNPIKPKRLAGQDASFSGLSLNASSKCGEIQPKIPEPRGDFRPRVFRLSQQAHVAAEPLQATATREASLVPVPVFVPGLVPALNFGVELGFVSEGLLVVIVEAALDPALVILLSY